MLLNAVTQDRTGDLQIFSLTLSQLSYRGHDSKQLEQCLKWHVLTFNPMTSIIQRLSFSSLFVPWSILTRAKLSQQSMRKPYRGNGGLRHGLENEFRC